MSEAEMLQAIGRLALEEQAIAEPAGAAATAGFLKASEAAHQHVVLLVSGISPEVLWKAVCGAGSNK